MTYLQTSSTYLEAKLLHAKGLVETREWFCSLVRGMSLLESYAVKT
jgi:hypothetical protein